MRSEFIRSLCELSEGDPSTFLVIGDLGYGVIEPFAERFPDRFLNAGVAEQSMVGVAAGLASQGHTVFVYSIANFPTLRALEQVRNDVAYHGHPVVIVSVGAGLSYGTLGYSHHAVEDLAIMRAIPNISVYSPGDALEVAASLKHIIRNKTPAYLRLGKGGEPALLEGEPADITFGNPVTVGTGDTLLLSTGSVGFQVKEAVQSLPPDVRNLISHYSIPSISSLDLERLEIDGATHIAVVEEHSLRGGFGSFVLEELNRLGRNMPTLLLGIRDTQSQVVGSHDYLRRHHGLDAISIATALETFLTSK
jgi:transketolase